MLPYEKGLLVDGRTKIQQFRSHWQELGSRLREYRSRYGLTQVEIARAVGAAGASSVAQWESGTTVPDGIRREHLVDLLEGRR
jgi:DNA-binding transcriptional regulator YiaG